MSSTSAAQSGQYGLVSSFYGPGAVVGWYLTALACLVSFSLHPRKRSRDSITADLIAVLTFPTVAAVDLITQARSLAKDYIPWEWKLNTASIEASLLVTEKFLAINMVFFIWVLRFQCVKRACLLATVGLFCLFAECFVFLSFSERSPQYYQLSATLEISPGTGGKAERTFEMLDGKVFISDGKAVSNNGKVLISVMAVLFVCIIWALSPIAILFSTFIPKPHARPSDRDIEAYALTIINWLSLPCVCIATMFPLSSNVFMWFASPSARSIRDTASRTAHDLIPKSNTSVKELDQAVALLAGATVLGFSLYSTANAYYQGIELRTLDHNQASTHSRELDV